MTEHKATPEQWEVVELCQEEGKIPWATATCLLELRARVEALEAAANYPAKPDSSPVSAEQEARNLLERMGVEGAQNLRASDLTELGNLISNQSRLLAKQTAPAPAGSLVERVEARAGGDGRAAILEVSAHIRANFSSGPSVAAGIALWLEQEADRG